MVFDKVFWFFCAAVGIFGGIAVIWVGLTSQIEMTHLPFGYGAAILIMGGIASFCWACHQLDVAPPSVSIEE